MRISATGIRSLMESHTFIFYYCTLTCYCHSLLHLHLMCRYHTSHWIFISISPTVEVSVAWASRNYTECKVHCNPFIAYLPQVARFLGEVTQQDLEDVVRTLGFFQTATDTLESEGPTAFLVPVVRERAERELAPDATDRPFVRRVSGVYVCVFLCFFCCCFSLLSCLE